MTTTITLPRRQFVDAVLSSCHGDFVRLELINRRLYLVGSDLVTMTVMWFDVSIPDLESITVPSKLLAASLKGLTDEDLAVTISGSRLGLRCGKHQSEVAAQGRLPNRVDVPSELWRELSIERAQRLKEALSAVAPAALADTSRPAVSGVRCDDLVVATDGARMHSYELNLGGTAFTLPTSAVPHLISVLTPAEAKKTKKNEVVTPPQPVNYAIAVSERSVALRGHQRDVIVRRCPEPYCDWRRIHDAVMTPESTATARLRRDDLLAVLKACPADAVTLELQSSTVLQITYIVLDTTATRWLGSGSVDVAAQIVGDGSVKVSTKNLTEALRGCGDEVVLHVAASQPLKLTSGPFKATVMFTR